MQRALKEAFKTVPFEMLSGGGGSGAGGATGASMGIHSRGIAGGGGGASGGRSSSQRAGGALSGATEPESIRGVKEALNLPHINHEKWLTLPRKYTRMVSRFELPIDSTELSRKHSLLRLSPQLLVASQWFLFSLSVVVVAHHRSCAAILQQQQQVDGCSTHFLVHRPF